MCHHCILRTAGPCASKMSYQAWANAGIWSLTSLRFDCISTYWMPLCRKDTRAPGGTWLAPMLVLWTKAS